MHSTINILLTYIRIITQQLIIHLIIFVLANTIDKNNNFRKYLQNASESTLYFEPITEHKTMKLIENLKNKTSTRIDGISNQLLKSAKNVLVKPITTIIN